MARGPVDLGGLRVGLACRRQIADGPERVSQADGSVVAMGRFSFGQERDGCYSALILQIAAFLWRARQDSNLRPSDSWSEATCFRSFAVVQKTA
jgi:hypothetical protein